MLRNRNMKMTVLLCAVVFLCLLPHPMIQAQSIDTTLGPNSVDAVQDTVPTFACTFTENSPPIWNILYTDGTTAVLSNGETSGFFYYPEITAVTEGGTVSRLHVTADMTLNGTMYKCSISMIGGGVESDSATLTVYGVPLPPHAIPIEERYRSVRVGWALPWSHTLVPVTGYIAQLLTAAMDVQKSDDDIPTGLNRENTFDNLVQETMYHVRVAAVNSVGQSDWSPLVTFTTPLPDVPTPPTSLTLMLSFAGTIPTVTASWTAPEIDLQSQTEVTGYTIFHKESSAADFSSADFTDEITSYEIPSAEFAKTYTVKATATNSGGNSAESEEVSITAEYLQSVTQVAGVNTLNITCNFASSDLALECAVELVGPTPMSLTATPTGDSPTFMVADLEAGSYNYTAKATGADGAGSDFSILVTGVEVTAVATEPPDPTEEPTEEPTPSETPSTDPPTVLPPPAGQSFTTTEIGIIAGVVVGVFLLLVLVPCCIFSCFVVCRKGV